MEPNSIDRIFCDAAQIASTLERQAYLEQAAAALGISVRTANRHWAYAKAFLYQRLSRQDEAGA